MWRGRPFVGRLVRLLPVSGLTDAMDESAKPWVPAPFLAAGRHLHVMVPTGAESRNRTGDISADDVLAAGASILAEGREVTGWSLRRACGNRGRPDRLLELWAAATAPRDTIAPAAAPGCDDPRAILPAAIEERHAAARRRV